ncbi:MAG: hypothetical protein F6K51_31890 [Moorea sp. SIO3I8]|nr:hypothetical protein [Moorena sp. SIO3I8]
MPCWGIIGTSVPESGQPSCLKGVRLGLRTESVTQMHQGLKTVRHYLLPAGSHFHQ